MDVFSRRSTRTRNLITVTDLDAVKDFWAASLPCCVIARAMELPHVNEAYTKRQP